MKPATAPSAVKIQAVLGERFTVLEFEAGTRSAAGAAAAIGCAVAEIAKSMIFRTVTSGRHVGLFERHDHVGGKLIFLLSQIRGDAGFSN